MNEVMALVLVGLLWVAVTRLLARSLQREDADREDVDREDVGREDVDREANNRPYPARTTWAQIPVNRRTDVFPGSRTAQPHTGT